MRLKRVTTPDALEATDKLVLCDWKESRLRMRWRRLTNLSYATEESHDSGCFGGDKQTCPVRLKRAATPDALEATDRLVVCDSGCFRSDTTLDALEATDFVFV